MKPSPQASFSNADSQRSALREAARLIARANGRNQALQISTRTTTGKEFAETWKKYREKGTEGREFLACDGPFIVITIFPSFRSYQVKQKKKTFEDICFGVGRPLLTFLVFGFILFGVSGTQAADPIAIRSFSFSWCVFQRKDTAV